MPSVSLIVAMACAALLGYVYGGYCLLLAVIRAVRGEGPSDGTKAEVHAPETELPFLSIVVAAHNEERVIGDRIRNLLELDYPTDRREILIVSDGSTDRTEAIVETFSTDGVRLLRTHRVGKSGAQNEAIARSNGDLVVLSDADASFGRDFLRITVERFRDSRVGCCTGELAYVGPEEDETTESLSLYWRLELWTRRLESDLGLLFTTSGPCMTFRRSLFRPMEREYGDDCVIPLDVLLAGSKVVCDPRARVRVEHPGTVRSELRGRIRMTLRNWTGTLSRRALLDPRRHPGISFAIVSHKLLRWTSPFLLLGLLFSSVLLRDRPIFALVAAAVLLLFGLAALGSILPRRLRPRLLSIPLSFCVANLGMLIGTLKALAGGRVTEYRKEQVGKEASP